MFVQALKIICYIYTGASFLFFLVLITGGIILEVQERRREKGGEAHAD